MCVFWFAGELPIPGLGTVSFVDKCHYLYLGRNPKYDHTVICDMSADICPLQE